MSEVRLIIRDAQHDLSGRCHGSVAVAVIAALSVEPETIEELEVALERFRAPGVSSPFHGFATGLEDEPDDAGLVVVDLAARLVVCQSTYAAAGREGYVFYHNGRCATRFDVRYHLSEDWRLSDDAEGWRGLAETRRTARAGPLDARAVLYGRPFLECLARACFESFAGGPLSAEDQAGASPSAAGEEYQVMKQIHARWLTEPRDDLRGQAPRDVLLAKHDHLVWDLQDRSEQWSLMGACPRGLDPESSAYRFGGFGTHELVVYYDLVRFLLSSCRESVAAQARSGPATAAAAGDFLPHEVDCLAEVLEGWLDCPNPEFGGHVPRVLIANERARRPEAVTGHEAVVDPDCPLRAMQAELPGPVFWNLDGCNMDDDFAFSFHRTRAGWEAEQREYKELSRRFHEREAARQRLRGEDSGAGWTESEGVWHSSFAAPEAPDEPVSLRLFTLGAHLAELITDLK
jgi:hypothetical protein